MSVVTVSITTVCEGEPMDTDFQVYPYGEFWAVGLKGESVDLFFDYFDTYAEALAFALEPHNTEV